MGKSLLYQGNEDVRDQWLDFRFVTRWDSTSKGSVDATFKDAELSIIKDPQSTSLAPVTEARPDLLQDWIV